MTNKFQYNKITFIPYAKLTTHDIKEILTHCRPLRFHGSITDNWDYNKFCRQAGNTDVEVFLLYGVPVLPMPNQLYEYHGSMIRLAQLKPFLATVHLLVDGVDNSDTQSLLNYHLGNLLSLKAIKDFNYVKGPDGWKHYPQELERRRVGDYENKEAFHDITCDIHIKKLKNEEEDITSARDVIHEITHQLMKAEGAFIEQIASLVLTRPIRYIGDSLFEYTDTSKR